MFSPFLYIPLGINFLMLNSEGGRWLYVFPYMAFFMFIAFVPSECAISSISSLVMNLDLHKETSLSLKIALPFFSPR